MELFSVLCALHYGWPLFSVLGEERQAPAGREGTCDAPFAREAESSDRGTSRANVALGGDRDRENERSGQAIVGLFYDELEPHFIADR